MGTLNNIIGRLVYDHMAMRVVLGQDTLADLAEMKEAEVGGVDVALEGLQVIAFALDEGDGNFVFRFG